MRTRIEYELNKTYLVLETNGKESPEDYQYRMLIENSIQGIIQPECRVLNSNFYFYFDISEKESLLHYLTMKSADYEFIQELFSSILCASGEIQRFLLEERNLVLKPEFIYRDIKTGCFGYICYPDKDEGTLQELLQFVMTHLNNDDMRAVSSIYGIYDMADGEKLLIKSAYEIIMKEGQSIQDDNMEVVMEVEGVEDSQRGMGCEENHKDETRRSVYRPSTREIFAALFILSGVLIVYITEHFL